MPPWDFPNGFTATVFERKPMSLTREHKKFSMTNNDLIELFKSTFALKFDVQVGQVLMVDSAAVRAWKDGRRPVPVEVKLRLLRHINYTNNMPEIAAAFTNIQEHNKVMQEERERITQIQRKMGVDSFVEHQELLQQLEEVHQTEQLPAYAMDMLDGARNETLQVGSGNVKKQSPQLRPIQQAALDAFTSALHAGAVTDGECVALMAKWVVGASEYPGNSYKTNASN
jgi:hypothetical protein